MQEQYFLDYVPVPSIFQSDLTGDLIKRCINCDTMLVNDGTEYMIEKAYKRDLTSKLDHTVFEYAICNGCASDMQKELSQDSRLKIGEFFNAHIDLNQRRADLSNQQERDPGKWLEKCVITGKPIESCTEYQIFCQCDGPDMLYTSLPYAISGEACEMIQKLLSPATKDELNRFTDEILGIPPELKELFDDAPVLMF